jgi:hypothetical protein
VGDSTNFFVGAGRDSRRKRRRKKRVKKERIKILIMEEGLG